MRNIKKWKFVNAEVGDFDFNCEYLIAEAEDWQEAKEEIESFIIENSLTEQDEYDYIKSLNMFYLAEEITDTDKYPCCFFNVSTMEYGTQAEEDEKYLRSVCYE